MENNKTKEIIEKIADKGLEVCYSLGENMYKELDQRARRTITQRLKELRKKSNLTQQEMANKLAISQSAYALYETGKKIPRLGTLMMLCHIHKVSLDYLVGLTRY